MLRADYRANLRQRVTHALAGPRTVFVRRAVPRLVSLDARARPLLHIVLFAARGISATRAQRLGLVCTTRVSA